MLSLLFQLVFCFLMWDGKSGKTLRDIQDLGIISSYKKQFYKHDNPADVIDTHTHTHTHMDKCGAYETIFFHDFQKS